MVVGDAISRGINLLVAMLEITLNRAPKIVPAVTITTLADSLVAKPPRSLRPRLPPTGWCSSYWTLLTIHRPTKHSTTSSPNNRTEPSREPETSEASCIVGGRGILNFFILVFWRFIDKFSTYAEAF